MTTKTPSKTPLAVLRRARKLLARPGTFYKGSLADWRYSNDGLQPVSFCAIGAIGKADTGTPCYRDSMSDAGADALVALAECIDPYHNNYNHNNYPSVQDSITDFNDAAETTQQDVLEKFDCAIESLRPKPRPKKKAS